MSAEKLASEAQVWRLNKEGLLGEALKRSPSGVIGHKVAGELVARWFEEHPEAAKPRREPATSKPRRVKKARRLEKQQRALEKLARRQPSIEQGEQQVEIIIVPGSLAEYHEDAGRRSPQTASPSSPAR